MVYCKISMRLPWPINGNVQQFFRWLAGCIALATAYYLTARVGFSLAEYTEQVTTVWPPAGIAVAVVFLYGYRYVPGIVLGAFFANVFQHEPFWAAALIALGNALESWVAAWLLHRLRFRARMARVGDIISLSLVAGFSAAFAATVGVWTLVLAGIVSLADYSYVWFTWWSGDAVGIFITASAIFAWAAIAPRLKLSPLRWAEAIFTFVLNVAIIGFLFLAEPGTYPVRYLIFPLGVYAVFRFGQIGAVTLSMIAAFSIIIGTAIGRGPFAAVNGLDAKLFPSLLYIFIVALTTQILGALLAERDEALAAQKRVSDKTIQERDSTIAQTEVFLDSIIENIPHMIFVKDAKDLRFVRFNRAGEELLGYPREALMGKSDYDFFPPDQAEFFVKKDRGVIERGGVTDIPEETITTRAGDVRILRTKKMTIPDDNGNPHYLLGISEDITARKQSEAVQSAFISLASHQLRTPLTAVRWILGKLHEGTIPEEKREELIEKAHQAAVQMTRSIRTMLTVSEVDAGSPNLTFSSVSLRTLIDEVIRNQQSVSKEHSAAIRVSCSDIPIETDDHLLREILGNVISNACKYTPATGSVNVNVQNSGNAVTISVIDTGCGIPAAEQKRVFSKFFRASNVVSGTTEGTGLGLYLVYALVRALAGTIDFESVEGKGTTFTLVFPSSMHV